jgi:diaminopimelate decarboxylase
VWGGCHNTAVAQTARHARACTHRTAPHHNAPHHTAPQNQASALIKAHALDDTTYLYDLGNTTRLFKAWCGALPRVKPFYAVKCNPEVCW